MSIKPLKLLRNSAAAIAVASVFASPAAASVINTFEFSGEAFAQGALGTFPDPATFNTFPSSSGEGVARFAGPFDVDTGTENATNFAVIRGFGETAPELRYGAGATAAGNANVSARTVLRQQITNNSASAQEALWSFLIFSGGVGIVGADLFGSNCSAFQLDQCTDTLGSPTPGSAFSSMMFELSLDGVNLLSAQVDVDLAGNATSSFSGFALNGFGLSSNNSLFFEWDETIIQQSLGVFDAGETKELVYSVTTIASSTGGCFLQDCLFATSGFGDPPQGGNGGIGHTFYALSDSSVPNDLDDNGQVDFADVPAPGALILTLFGLGAAAAFRRRK